MVYVEPGVAIMDDHDGNATSIRDFAGYHSAFVGRTAGGYAADIHYAVMAYAGGINPVFRGLTPFGSMTLTASHEIAEAATDPNVGLRALGWYDDNNNGEIGDINRYEALLNGYAVQSIVNKYDVAYVPSGATTLRPLDAVSSRGSAGAGGQSHEVDALFALLADSQSSATPRAWGRRAAHSTHARNSGSACSWSTWSGAELPA